MPKTQGYGVPLLRVVLVFAASWIPRAAQAEVLSEAEVVRLALETDPESLVSIAEAELADARAVEAGLYPNPVASWERQRIAGSGPNAQSQDEITVSVPLSISGRRRARRDVARAGAALARADAARARSQAAVRALSAYQSAIAARERVEILRRASARFDEAARVLGRREEEGIASGYERTRIEIAAELARSDLREAEANAEILREQLATLLGLSMENVEVPDRIERPSTPVTEGPTRARPSIERAREAIEAAADASRSARRASIPDLSIEGGLFIGSQERTEVGYAVGASVELPIASRGQELRAEASAQRSFAIASLAAAERTIAIEGRRAERELSLALLELRRFEAAAMSRMELLERSVESGYREGRRSILELVDVQRTRAEVEERRLELALSAKRAEIALRAARGEFE